MNTPRLCPDPAALRRSLCWLFCLAVGTLSGRAALADDGLPQPPPPKRYDKLASRSPFAPPTAPLPPPSATPPPPPGPAWTDNLTVTSLMQSNNVYTATVMEKDTSARHFIRSDVEDPDSHLTLASVRWADKPDAIKVTVRKGTLFGDLHFDPGAAGSGSGGGPPPNLPSPPFLRPGMPNPAANFHPPPPVAASAQNPSGGPPGNIVRGRPVIRANPPPVQTRPVIAPPPVPNRVAPAVKPGKDEDDDDE